MQAGFNQDWIPKEDFHVYWRDDEKIELKGKSRGPCFSWGARHCTWWLNPDLKGSARHRLSLGDEAH